MNKIYKTIIILLIIQLALAYFCFKKIQASIPVDEDDLTIIEKATVDVAERQTRLTLTHDNPAYFLIEACSRNYKVDGIDNQKYSVDEINEMISSGDTISFKYITKHHIIYGKSYVIVELQDSQGNYLRTLDDYNSYVVQTRPGNILLMTIAESLFLFICGLIFFANYPQLKQLCKERKYKNRRKKRQALKKKSND